MSKYPVSPGENDAPLKETSGTEELELPIDREFLSLPPRLEPQVMLRRIEETMPWRSTRPGEQERRLAGRIDVEFVL